MGIYPEPLPALKGQHTEECDLDGGKVGTPPPKMTFGRLIDESEHAYCWGYFDHGRLTHALIAPWEHMDVLTFLVSHALADMGHLYARFRQGQPLISGMFHGLNLSLNDGYVAGQRNWHAHAWIIPRRPGLPSSCMGTNMALKRFDGLVTQVGELTESLDGPYPRAQLMGYLHQATQL
jgi:diadenosine tetraphosphate (Ap4A) HIT family hydrolase